jgi:hypothetical protein
VPLVKRALTPLSLYWAVILGRSPELINEKTTLPAGVELPATLTGILEKPKKVADSCKTNTTKKATMLLRTIIA